MKRKIFILVFVLVSQTFLFGQTPTKWRGPQGNGKYNESGLLTNWPASGPEVIWHFDQLGDGFSSPVVANGKIYLTGMEETTGYIYCLAMDGKLEWKAQYGEEFIESYPGSRTTPVIADGLLYMFSGNGVLVCLDANNGSIKWKKDTFKEFDGKNIRWGVTETLVVDSNKVYCTPGGNINNVVALDRFNGKVLWSSPGLGELSAYCSPLLVELPTRKLLITHTASHIIGIDANTGNLLWSHEQPNQYSVHANTPIFADGGLFCFSGYGRGGVKLTLSTDGSSVKQEWFNSKLDGRMGGAVLVNGYIYISGDNNREWRCVDWKTGVETYSNSSIGKGNIIYADGLLFCYSEKGELALVEANSGQFKVLSQAKVQFGTAQHWAHPVLNNGRLYLRHGKSLITYKVK